MLGRQLNQIRTWAQQGRTDAWIAHKLDTTPETIAEFRADNALTRGGGGAVPAPVTPERVAETALDDPPASATAVADADDAADRPEPRRRTKRRRVEDSDFPGDATDRPATPAEQAARRRSRPAGDETPQPTESSEPVAETAAEAGPRRRRRSRARVGEGEPAETPAATEPAAVPEPAAAAPEPTDPVETAEAAPRRRRRTRTRADAEPTPAPVAEAEAEPRPAPAEPPPAAARIRGALRTTVALELDGAVLDDPVFREHWAGASRLEAEVTPDAIVLRRT